MIIKRKYKCKLCKQSVLNVPSKLDNHLYVEHDINIYNVCKADEWNIESIYDEYYKRNV